jgi:glycosyltransferase involved in cell wall biosynthesis
MGLEGRRVLFISYNGMLDPLGQTQVLPYLRELAKNGVCFTLLSFEREGAYEPAGVAQCNELRRVLLTQGIEWHWLRYHKRPSVPATTYDVMIGVRYASRLVKRNQIEMVHARGHIPATIGLVLKRRFGVKLIFDIRGLMAEEYVDAAHWTKGGIPYRLTKIVERRALAGADAIVTLTERIWPIIKDWDGLRGREVTRAVIPCCVDLDLFKFLAEARTRSREKLNLGDRFTLVYSGSLDGWYLTERMADFFAQVLQARPDAHLLWLTTGSHRRIRDLMSEREIDTSAFSIYSMAAAEVPTFLSAADAGIAFIKCCVSKIASSPTKHGEYLACGLPLVINPGIGDSDALVDNWKVGVMVREFSDDQYAKAAVEVGELVRNPEMRTAARAVAERLFDVREVGAKRYADLYQRVLTS